MKQLRNPFLFILLSSITFTACEKEQELEENPSFGSTVDEQYPAVSAKFGGVIDLWNLENYAAQPVPAYITKDNTAQQEVTDEGATLGRVLFYDRELSIDRSISCASCHQQAFAFSDPLQRSNGVEGGLTGRHSMRLVNARFANEQAFFWDERAATLEQQTTLPIQDHFEMGFSGQDGRPGLSDLILRMQALDYYKELFTFVYGDSIITEARMQLALAQFIRSMQSFDSKYDAGRARVNNELQPFPNFTAQENMGKRLYITSAANGGAGCQGCHQAPEFDIDPNSGNNGVIGNLSNPAELDLTVTRSPSLRDLVNPNGRLNGPMMHDGSMNSLAIMIEHYNNIPVHPENTQLDPRLRAAPNQGAPAGQQLQLNAEEKDALIAFLGTLSGNNIYTHAKWSDPF